MNIISDLVFEEGSASSKKKDLDLIYWVSSREDFSGRPGRSFLKEESDGFEKDIIL